MSLRTNVKLDFMTLLVWKVCISALFLRMDSDISLKSNCVSNDASVEENVSLCEGDNRFLDFPTNVLGENTRVIGGCKDQNIDDRTSKNQ